MNPFVEVLGWALVHSLWEGCALVLLAALVGFLLPGRIRHGVHGLALLLCLLLPLATALQVHPPRAGEGPMGMGSQVLEDPGGSLAPEPPVAAALLTRLEAALQPRLPFLVACWALGAGFMTLRLGGGILLVQRWRRQGRPAPSDWQSRAEALARRLGVRRPVRLLLVAQGHTPMALGLWKPVVLLPVALLSSLPPAYLEALLAHELAHVRRLDYLANLLQGLVETLLFYHPAVWWLSARIRAEREELADQLAVEGLGDPRCLARALDALDDLQPTLTPTLFPALAARGGHLLTRIERLLAPQPALRLHWGLLAALLVPGMVLALRAAGLSAPPIGAPAAVVAQLDALAAQEHLDPHLLRSMAWAESNLDASAKSPLGATGLLQVMPATARAFGAKDLDDPAQVMAAGAKYLRFLLDRYQGDLQKAVAAYNCGEKALDEGRITDEALHYRALVMQVLAAKAVQPETPLAEGEVQGVIRRMGGRMSVQLRVRQRGNLKVDLLAAGDDHAVGTLRIGSKQADGTYASGPWAEARPRIVVDAPKAGTTLVVRCEEPGLGWRGEVPVVLDGAWTTFACRMTPLKP